MRLHFLLPCGLLVFVACGNADSPDSNPPGPDAGPDAGPVATTDAGMNSPDGGDLADAGMGADLTFDQTQRGTIDTPGDVDLYTIDLTEGEFIRISTDTVEINDVRTDTVVRLFDPMMNLVAESDDAVPRLSVESSLEYRVPATGRYTVSVQEFSSWAPSSTMAKGGANYRYLIIATQLLDSDENVVIHDERGDESDPKRFEGARADLLGVLDDTSDIDVFRLSAVGEFSYIWLVAGPPGPNGHGSTTTGGTLRLTHVDTATLTASVDLRAGYSVLELPGPPGEYSISIDHAGDRIGANDFYRVRFFLVSRVQTEPGEQTNDDPAGAATLELGRVWFTGTLGDGDVDYVALDSPVGESLSAFCRAESIGSGIIDFAVELIDPNGVELARATDDSPGGALAMTQTSTSGLHYVRLSKGGQRPAPSSTHYRCAMNSVP